MVVQKNWNNVDTSHQNPVSESSSGTWGFQAPTKSLHARSNTPNNMQTVSLINLLIVQ